MDKKLKERGTESPQNHHDEKQVQSYDLYGDAEKGVSEIK